MITEKEQIAPWMVFFSLAVPIIYLIWIAVRIKVDPFDTYAIYLNARTLAFHGTGTYFDVRPPIVPLLLAPLFTLQKLNWDQSSILISSRIVFVFIFGTYLWTSYRLLRLHLSKIASSAGVLLLGTNPMLLHHAPFVREDILGALFVEAVFLFYLKAEKRRRAQHLIAAFLFLTMAALTRYNLVFVLAAFFLLNEIFLVFQSIRKRMFFNEILWFFKKIFFYAILPSIGVILLISAVYHWTNQAPFDLGMKLFLMQRAFDYGTFQSVMVSTATSLHQNVTYIVASMSLPVLLLSVLGLIVLAAKKNAGSVFHALWISVFLSIQIFWIRHNELRYLFPIFVSLYFFAAEGFYFAVRFAFRLSQKLSTSWRPVVTPFVVAALLFWPIKKAAAELLRFRDPVYISDFSRQVCMKANELAGDQDIFWVGTMYPIHPKIYKVHRYGKYSYIYHLFNHVCGFYTGKKVRGISDAEIDVGRIQQNGALPIPTIGVLARDGDVLIVNSEPESYSAQTLPAHLKPLILQKIKTWSFLLLAQTAEGAKVYFSPDVPGARVIVYPQEGRFAMHLENIPPGEYEFYAEIVLRESRAPLGYISVENENTIVNIDKNFPEVAGRVLFLTYEDIVQLKHPD